jgi:hypothetical protein
MDTGVPLPVCTHAFGSFQETTVGVRSGSPLTMCKSFIDARSARPTDSGTVWLR